MRGIGRELELSDEAIDFAYSLFKKARRLRITTGGNIQIVAGAIYAACRIYNYPRSLLSIARAARINQRDVGKAFRSLAMISDREIPPYDLSEVLRRICKVSGVSPRVQTDALRMIEQVRMHDFIIGKDPWGLCAAVLYITSLRSENNLTQRQVARAADVTEVTVRNRYQELVKEIEIYILNDR